MTECGQCRYIAAVADDAGLCRKYAPRPIVVPDSDYSADIVVWPIVALDEVCGEWAARDVQ